VFSIAKRLSATKSLWLGGTSFLCIQLVDYFPINISILGYAMKFKVIILYVLHIIVSRLCNSMLVILICIFMAKIIINIHACVKF
jgi:hypothetical protein